MGTIEWEIPARDGFPLRATIHEAEDQDAVVVLSAATGVPHKFYRRFSEALAAGGLTTVTYDYRGVAASRPGSLKGFRADLTDWALQDMGGVIDWSLDEFGVEAVRLVGHSFGGQVAGLYDRPERIDRMVTFSSQSGHWRHQGGNQPLIVGFQVYVTLPLLCAIFGYAPWSKFASAEDLPKGAALQWCRWCRHTDYLFSDDSLPLDRYDTFSAPVLAYSFDDDDWGTASSVDRLMAHYPRVERRHVIPADEGIAHIGHMGYFREASSPLWQEAIDWLRA